MVIALIANRGYKIQCRDGEIWWSLKSLRRSPRRLDTFEYGKKITFVAQGDAYYYPWIQLQNVNQR